MERSETVNAEPVRLQNTSIFSVRPAADYGAPDAASTLQAPQPKPQPIPTPIRAKVTSQASDQGPCLYLGPAGQRCERRAASGGFCQWHQPGAPRVKVVNSAARYEKRLAAIIAILAALWPLLMDFLHALAKLFR